MRRVITSIVGAALAATGLVAAPAASFGSTGPVVDLAGYTEMAVDGAHGHVLVTSGDASPDVTVLGLDGTLQGTVPGMPGAEDIHLSADGSSFYVTLSSEHAIGVVDSSTLSTSELPLGASVCPTSTTQVGQVLWFTYTDCQGGPGDLGSLQLGPDTVTLDLADAGSLHRIDASSVHPGRLVAEADGGLVVLDVSGGPTTAAVTGTSASVAVRDITMAPDGEEVVVATDDSGYVGLSAWDLSRRSSYPGASSPTAVAVRGDGLVAVGGAGVQNRDVHLYQENQPGLFRSYRVGDGTFSLVQHGLAFGKRDLYAMTQNPGTTSYRLVGVTPKRPTSMTVTRGATVYRYGATAKVTVHLTVPGATVSVYATPYGGTRKLLERAAVDARGNLVVTTPVRVRTTFSATYAGDSGHDAVSGSTTVAVRASATIRVTRVVGTSGAYRLVKVGSRPATVGTIRPYHVNQCVKFQLQQPTGSGWGYTQTTGCIRLGTYSTAAVGFDPSWPRGARARSRVLWAGDTRNAAATSSWVYLKFVS